MPLFTMLIYLSVVSNMQAYSKEEATIPPIVFESARLCRSVCFHNDSEDFLSPGFECFPPFFSSHGFVTRLWLCGFFRFPLQSSVDQTKFRRFQRIRSMKRLKRLQRRAYSVCFPPPRLQWIPDGGSGPLAQG